MTASAATMDHRRRLHLPKDLTAAAGLAPGHVVLLPGAAGEVIVATPAAALTRLRRAVASALTLTGQARSLSAVLAAQPGRAPAAPARPGPAALPDDGPILADTTVLTALLDADPVAEPLVPLLPRLQVVEAVVGELLHTVLEAGLPSRDDDPASFASIMATLTALGLTETGGDEARASVRVREYELTKAGVPTLAERVTLAVAATRDLPALLGRTVPPADTVAVSPYDYRTLAVATVAPVGEPAAAAGEPAGTGTPS